MKQISAFAPTFTPGAAGAGTLNFTGYPGGFSINSLICVVNLTRGTVIYAPGSGSAGLTSFAANVVTLQADTSTHSSGDLLAVYYDTLDLGLSTDTAASSDTGTFSLIALTKRVLSKLPSFGPALVAASQPIAFARKQSITGTTISTTVTNANLLDGAGTGLATDVRDFQSGKLIVVSTAATGSYTIQAAFDSAFTIGLQTLQAQEDTSQVNNPLNAAITPTAATRIFDLNLVGINYLRVNLSTGPTTGSITAYAALNQLPNVPHQFNTQQATAANLNATVTATNLSCNNAQWGGTTVVNGGLAGTVGVGGAVAAGGVVTSNPVQIGMESRTTQRAASADAVAARPIVDKLGRVVSKLGQIRELQDTNPMVTITTTTETTIIAAIAAIANDLTDMFITNTGSVDVRVDIRDTTAGTVRMSFYVKAGASQPLDLSQPLKQAAVNTNWTAQLSVVPTGGDVRITALSERVS